MKVKAGGLFGSLGRLREKLSDNDPGHRGERRESKRASLRIPVQVKVGDAPAASSQLHDISPSGLCFAKVGEGTAGDRVWLRFDGYPGVCEDFVLAATLARVTEDVPERMAARIDRERTRPQALEQYRKLVLHYLRHRPLLEEKDSSFVEGRCKACGWVGRVSVRNRVCSRCGQPVNVVLR